ncbi:MAG: hypothetical protein QOD39_2577 [Mycobacterium sp.]|jgi:pimeloyl-ACP methyl ester carboxylesterase|nr:hypothetical protein [Mycobacterium sp.]
MPRTAAELTRLLSERRLDLPVLAIGAKPVGPALAAQLAAWADDLTTVQLDDCGHVIPLDAPDRLLAALLPWLGDGRGQLS